VPAARFVKVVGCVCEWFAHGDVACCLCSAYYRPVFSDTPDEDHRKWNRDLGRAVDHICQQQNGVQRCFELLLDELRQFAETAETNVRDGGKEALARMFFRCVNEAVVARLLLQRGSSHALLPCGAGTCWKRLRPAFRARVWRRPSLG